MDTTTVDFIDKLQQSWPEIYGDSVDSAQFCQLRSYRIDDILPLDMQRGVVFLLESPHIDEVCLKYPLAGRSGKDVACKLDPLGIPAAYYGDSFGCILKGNLRSQIPVLSGIGVMNVNRLPMQAKAYSHDICQPFDAMLKSFKILRDPKAIDRNNRGSTKEIKQLLIDDLASRIGDTHPETCFVPCGKVAEAFFHKASVSVRRPYTCLQVPHPSHGQWKRRRYEGVLYQLITEIQLYLGCSL